MVPVRIFTYKTITEHGIKKRNLWKADIFDSTLLPCEAELYKTSTADVCRWLSDVYAMQTRTGQEQEKEMNGKTLHGSN